MLSRKIPKLKLDLKGKGRSRYILLHKYLLPGIPVLSIFALVGILAFSVMLPSNNLTRLFGIDKLFGLDSLLEDGDKAYAEEGDGVVTLATSETIGDSTASITISGAGREEVVSAGRGSTIYRTHSISMAGSNVRNYTLSIYGDSNLEYVGSGSGTSDGSSNDTLTSAGGVTGKTMNDSTTYDNTWGYGYGDSTTSNDSLTYKAPTGSTIGTAETLASGTIASSANGVLSISNKKLVFAAKFGEDKPQGNYRANVNLALTITPRVLTTYSITYSGNGNTEGSVPAKQSIDLYDTTSYNGFIAAANTGNLTKTGYNFLGWSESSTATSATYIAGSSTVSLTSSKPEITLYAVWEKRVLTLKDITKMQEMTADICKASSVGDTNTLTDTRDNNTYTIRKHEDNNCWMTQNLSLPGNTVISRVDSDLDNSVYTSDSQTYTLPSSTLPFNNTQTTDKTNVSTYMNQQVLNSSNSVYGAYYSWCAATAGTCQTGAYSDIQPSGSYGVAKNPKNTTVVAANTDASSSICPKGWHLPKGGAEGDFKTLYDLGQTKVGSFTSGSTSSGWWLGPGTSNNVGGIFFPVPGSVNDTGNNNTGTLGNYWSRTARNTTSAYDCFFSNNYVTPDHGYQRYYGYSVRCVAYSG